ncbi:MAG: HAMP domain-containing histidine kinase [Oscillospiraceae bacterium]|nr:HAMP domain-containing histidine kinase [Oscillospiraceae bacterium]
MKKHRRRWKNRRQEQRGTLTALFSAIIFLILTVTILLVGMAVAILVHTGTLHLTFHTGLPAVLFVAGLAGGSILMGTIVGSFIDRAPLRALNKTIDGINKLARGNYETRLQVSELPALGELAESFNTLAAELQNTEMLRSDFVNNFSHEFKTPIVSIQGFAKLLQKGNLTPEQQREYLDIIVAESGRLADMATNVLSLTRVENQEILTDVTAFNLSEQLRNCVLLLEKKWTAKNLDVMIDLEVYTIRASEALRKEVWINLLDNAIKFSPQNGEIAVQIQPDGEKLTVSVTNYGPDIPLEDQNRIFNKFYQGDTSHSGEGTGVGLAVAKRVTDLHQGRIEVSSGGGKTVFSVTLPKSV